MEKYKVDFNELMTREGLMESFKNLKEVGLDGYIEVDGKKYYASDPDLSISLDKIFSKIKEKRRKIYNELISTDEEFSREMLYLDILSRDRMFCFHLKNSLKYIDKKNHNAFIEDYINRYSGKSSKPKDIHFVSYLLLCLEEQDEIVRDEKISLFLLSLSEEDLGILNRSTLDTVKGYGKRGDFIYFIFDDNRVLEKIIEKKKDEHINEYIKRKERKK